VKAPAVAVTYVRVPERTFQSETIMAMLELACCVASVSDGLAVAFTHWKAVLPTPPALENRIMPYV
jgi:hypothetical protein